MEIDVATKYKDGSIVYACDNMPEAEDMAQYISKETGCGTKITVDDELGAAIIKMERTYADGINCADWSDIIRHSEEGTLQVFAKNIDGELDWTDVISATALLFRQHPVDEYVQKELNRRGSYNRRDFIHSIILDNDTRVVAELNKQEKIHNMPLRARIITHKDDVNKDTNIRILIVTYRCSDCLVVNGEIVHTGDVVYTMDNKAITIGARMYAYLWHNLDNDTEHLYSYLVDLEGKKVHGAIKKTLWSNTDRINIERGTKETKMTLLKMIKSLLGIG